MNKTNKIKHKLLNNNSAVFLLNSNIISTNIDNEDNEIIPLHNPLLQTSNRYLYNNSQKLLFEIQEFAEPNRSWFNDNHLLTSGSIYLTTPIDPHFFILFYIKKNCQNQYIPLDDILYDNNYPKLSIILNISSRDQLNLIADEKTDGTICAYKYNEAKTINWLAFKCFKLAEMLESKNIQLQQCASFVKSEQLLSKDEYTRISVGIISEYIPTDLADKLLLHFGLQDEENILSAANTSNIMETTIISDTEEDSTADEKNINEKITKKSVKRPSTGSDKSKTKKNATKQPAAAAVTEKKLNAREKSLAKAATGAKSITSFFSAKSK